MTRISIDEFKRRSAKTKRGNKLGARKTSVDGHVFDSRAEANRYSILSSMARVGQISDLVMQPSYSLEIGIYTADFRYTDKSGVVHNEDVKGVATEACRMRLKMMAKMGVLVELITKKSHPQYWKRGGR